MKLTQGQFMAYQGKYGQAALTRVHARIDALCEEECKKTLAPVTVLDPYGKELHTLIPVRFSCGLYVGPHSWHGAGERYEPFECGVDRIVVVDKAEYEEGHVTLTCPGCRSEVYQDDDHFHPLD